MTRRTAAVYARVARFIRHAWGVMTVAYFPTSAERGETKRYRALVIGDSTDNADRGMRTAELGGQLDSSSTMIGEAAARLEQLADLSVVWVEADEESEALRDVLQRVDADVRAGRYRAVIAIHGGLIDFVTAIVSAPDIEVVVGSSELERASALAIASMPRPSQPVREAGKEASAARLQQLSEEVSRIAAALAQLSAGPARADAVIGTPLPPRDDVPQVSSESVRTVIKARRLRGRLLPEDLFADPAWDMLLDLLQAELVQHRVPVSSLCIAAAVPATTALRWIKTLTDRGLLTRRADPHDGRRVFIEMSPPTSLAMRRFFAESGLALT